MKKIVLIIIAFNFLLAEKLPNDVRWVTKSQEYIMLCEQIYNIASSELDSYILNGRPKRNAKLENKNFAVVMDLDETVLNNSQYQIELHDNNETFNILIDCRNVSSFPAIYCMKKGLFLLKNKKLTKKYLKKSAIVITNNSVKNFLNIIFKISPPYSEMIISSSLKKAIKHVF